MTQILFYCLLDFQPLPFMINVGKTWPGFAHDFGARVEVS